MFETFDDFDKLRQTVLHDREFEGAWSDTADRFPVRFVLFDNFRDCCTFVEELMRLGDIQIQRIEDWLDVEYPDTMISHKKLADWVYESIQKQPTKYRIIMPFSELARFYCNLPEKAEFNTVVDTVKGCDSLGGSYKVRQRVYIPIVGLEGKMQTFKDNSQSFIWYFRNPDHQMDYRLVLTDKTTYGVQGLDDEYSIAENVSEWLGFWKYPELKEKIICTSHSIFSNAKYAQPDNAFSYCICNNAYEFMSKGLKLDVDCIEYREEESQYWEMLAKRINISHFKFEQFFNEQFGIHNLADYTVFFKQWFEHKDDFMRWLLAKYYIYKFCNEGYICRVLHQIDSYTNSSLVQMLARTIFTLDNPLQYIEEREIGLRLAAAEGVELPLEIQKLVVEKIEYLADTIGVLSAIPFIGTQSYAERRLIIKWYVSGKIDKNQLHDLYPDLYYYLGETIASSEEFWVLDYIDAYKEAKLSNCYTDKIKNYISVKNENELAHFKWSNKFFHTRSLLNSRSDIQQYFWIDGLGLDWVSFIEQIVKEMEPEGYYVNEVYVTTSILPTRTDVNRTELEKLSNGLCFDKIGDLDKVAHTSRKYPDYIIDDLNMMRKELSKMLKAHPGEKIAIVSDHGISYLSQLCDGENLKGYKSDHWGRVVEYLGKGSPVKDNKYILLNDNKTVCALGHASLGAKIPDGMGAHGGATPEEELVPVIIISPEEQAYSWKAIQKSYEIEEANPVFVVDIFGLADKDRPIIEYNGFLYNMNGKGSEYTSDRLVLVADVTKISLRIGHQTKEFSITIKMAVQEEDLFGDIL